MREYLEARGARENVTPLNDRDGALMHTIALLLLAEREARLRREYRRLPPK